MDQLGHELWLRLCTSPNKWASLSKKDVPHRSLQIPGPDNVILTFDPQLELVEKIAASLGLEIVGWLFTHLPREKLITSSEAIVMAR